MSSANLARIYIVEIKVVSLLLASGGEKMRGEKMQVSLIMLLKTNGEKMSDFWLAIMLLKIRYLRPLCHYITDNRWLNEGSGCRRIRSGVRGPESEVFGGWTRIPRFGFWQSRSGKEDSEFRAPVSRIPSPESRVLSQPPQKPCGSSGVAVYWGFDVRNLRQLVYIL
jgi:hypothetical protein